MAKKFVCIGSLADLSDPCRKPGEDSHDATGTEWWYNGYAGPFCRLHRSMWQSRLTIQYNATHVNQYPINCPRCNGQVMVDRLDGEYLCLSCGWRQEIKSGATT